MKGKFLNSISSNLGMTKLKIRKNSPELFLAAGIVSIIAGTIVACKASRGLDDIIDDHKVEVEEIHNKVDEEFQARELTKTYAKTGLKVAREFAPGAILIGVGICSVVQGHRILNNRYVAVSAAYKTLDDTFRSYRGRVVDRYGEEAEQIIYHNLREEDVEKVSIDENGNEEVTQMKGYQVDVNERTRLFDSSSREWDENPAYNMTTLIRVQNQWNDKLNSRGYVFFNEVLDDLDLLGDNLDEIGKAGLLKACNAGWIKGDVIDFGLGKGIFESEATRRFINGRENVVLLEFNYRDNIWDCI